MITYPVCAVDNSSVHPGRVYVVWAGLTGQGGLPHIYLSYSDDHGGTWSQSLEVDADFSSGQDKFHPWIAVDPKSGAVAISFYDSRNDFSNQGADMYTAISRDGGQTFQVQRVSNTTSGISPASGYWADYSAIAAYRGKVIPCWTDQRSGSSIYNTDVYVSIIGLGPGGVANLKSSISEASPSSIGLTWTDPTTTLGGDPMPSFNVVIYRDSQFLTTVPKGTQTYTDNAVITGSFHTYQVYVSTGVDTSGPAFASAYAGGALEPQAPVLIGMRETVDGTELKWRNPTKHVDGTALYDLGAVYIFVDGQRNSFGQLATDTGKIVTHLVNAPIRKFHSFVLSVVAQRLGITEASVTTDTVMWYSGAPLTSMNEGFESSPVLGSNGGWTTTTLGAHNGTHALTDNNAGKTQSRLNIYAILPPLVVQSNAPILSFWHCAIVGTLDSAVAEYTLDHGLTWKQIGRYTQASGQFTDNVSTSTWANVTYDFSPYIGDSIAVRFRMKTSSIAQLHKQGWFIDDVTMRATSSAVDEPGVPSAPLLMTASPNPCITQSVITAAGITIPRDASSVSLNVYDMNGRKIADLTPQLVAGAPLLARFDAADRPAGMYIARLRIGGREAVTRILHTH